MASAVLSGGAPVGREGARWRARGGKACEPQPRRRGKMRSLGVAIALLVGVWTVGAINAAADAEAALLNYTRR